MVLMHDPWGVYTYNEAVYVGRELERVGYYFFENPSLPSSPFSPAGCR